MTDWGAAVDKAQETYDGAYTTYQDACELRDSLYGAADRAAHAVLRADELVRRAHDALVAIKRAAEDPAPRYCDKCGAQVGEPLSEDEREAAGVPVDWPEVRHCARCMTSGSYFHRE